MRNTTSVEYVPTRATTDRRLLSIKSLRYKWNSSVFIIWIGQSQKYSMMTRFYTPTTR